MRRVRFMPRMFVSLVLMFTFVVRCGFAVEASLESALLRGNWEEVFGQLEKDDLKASDPVARLIMAHACLATNRNNASMLLFLSVKEEKELRLWSEWTESLLSHNPQSPMALYLSADAKARLGKLKEAEEGFSQALEIKGKFTLALNGRGVVRVLTNKWNEALIDFSDVTEAAPKFADAQANLGTYFVLKAAPDGALEAFNQALAHNGNFALAYNGRGCAYFGRRQYDERIGAGGEKIVEDDYEKAIIDMERAFELCPALVVALSNQGLVLAAIASESSPEIAHTKPGTTFIAKSDLGKMDYTSLTPHQAIQFHQSVDQLGQKDPLSAVQVYCDQLARVGNKRTEFLNEIERRQRLNVTSGKNARFFERMDQALGLVSLGSNALGLVSQPIKWNQFFSFAGGQSLQIAAGRLPEETAGKMWAEVGSRALDPATALLRVPLYLFKEGVDVVGSAARSSLSVYTTELAVCTRQCRILEQEQGRWMAEAINQGVDFNKMDAFGRGRIHTPAITPSPIPEYSIPYQSPLGQFNALPGAIIKDIAPSGRSPLVVIDGSVDSYRLGTMLPEFGNQGIRTLPVPSKMDAQDFGRMVGADRIVKITPQSGSASWLPLPSTSFPGSRPGSIASKPGGIEQDMSQARVDRGNWPVMTCFGLFYKAVHSTEE